jgi:predicted type IV restriction endonuclease
MSRLRSLILEVVIALPNRKERKRPLKRVNSIPILNALPSEEEASSEQAKLYCRGKEGADATGEYTEDGLVVFEGSVARTDTTPSASEAVDRRRQNLLADGVLEREGDQLVFRENHAFNTPSAASSTVLGRSSNGWREWTDGSGNSLDDRKRQ